MNAVAVEISSWCVITKMSNHALCGGMALHVVLEGINSSSPWEACVF